MPGFIWDLRMWRVGYDHSIAGVVYVDHAGATLHADSQLKAAMEDFSSNLYGNPRILLQFPALNINCFTWFHFFLDLYYNLESPDLCSRLCLFHEGKDVAYSGCTNFLYRHRYFLDLGGGILFPSTLPPLIPSVKNKLFYIVSNFGIS